MSEADIVEGDIVFVAEGDTVMNWGDGNWPVLQEYISQDLIDALAQVLWDIRVISTEGTAKVEMHER